jgi:glutaredoxin
VEHELVMYTRSRGCPFVMVAQGVLREHGIKYRTVNIDRDAEAEARLLEWVGFRSVPTLIVTAPGEVVPVTPPAPLPEGTSPRGIDRGAMITEPKSAQLVEWLQKHGFVA